jgi:leucyl/phenylalanyl-tRNA--protein transferase
VIDLPWIEPEDPPDAFPPVDRALEDPPGLLAAGGDLSPERLEAAYRRGIFPWFSRGDPILWWSPDPREILFPDALHVSRSLAKSMRSGRFQVTRDMAFADVVAACAAPRARSPGTWILPAMRTAYLELHRRGTAHSVEVWRDGRLVGGLYGVRAGAVFCGESMFSRASDASKVALAVLAADAGSDGLRLIDCQLENPHLRSLGSQAMPRAEFVRYLPDSLQ